MVLKVFVLTAPSMTKPSLSTLIAEAEKSLVDLLESDKEALDLHFKELLVSSMSKVALACREEVGEYTEHKPECIRSRYTAGRPTANGGYEQQFGSKWYEAKPIDKTPKCDCGLDEIITTFIGDKIK